eukprot:XP_008661525.2 dof zinc finger protein MNB1A-like [Zea mays]
MEAPLHQFPFPVPPPPQPQDALLQQAVAARALMMAGKRAPLQATAAAGREQCPRCASRDTKFCYYNNYNTAQPRHFCRACRRYWTLGDPSATSPWAGPRASASARRGPPAPWPPPPPRRLRKRQQRPPAARSPSLQQQC